ncbi:hypothetical protein GCM10011365_12610 [Marinicella pacifica]|uniref:Zinc finger/thioredoxin putative domain-containing protein n=1 Tax=Marinicella pacifica TaxID=1171543 RepID=A0A917FP71_9GAMM|nr:zinc-ribbon and DUF3426 domain-containing protein [Marinicella pacifica]GGF92822.1 hypothetical protein GCM10011365_12610 [Marinicella pacifica]
MLYTQCRGCGEVFIIDAEHLTLARGQVRCHVCGTVFDALQTLTSEQPLDGEDLLLHDDGHAPPLLTRSFHSDAALVDDESETEPDADMETAESGGIVPDRPDEPSDESLDGDSFSFLDDDDPPLKADLPYHNAVNHRSSGQKWWVIMSVVLLVVLIWQAQQALANGRLRLPESQWADKICESLTCARQNRPIDLNAMSLVSRNIRSHPGRDHALIISATMINTEADDKRFPALSIRLSDLEGQVVAMRRFKAEEYLSKNILKAGFIHNTLVPVTLEIQNPGEQAVAFEIGFSQP